MEAKSRPNYATVNKLVEFSNWEDEHADSCRRYPCPESSNHSQINQSTQYNYGSTLPSYSLVSNEAILDHTTKDVVNESESNHTGSTGYTLEYLTSMVRRYIQDVSQGHQCVRKNDIHASLENQDLWDKFDKIGTEMIVTKSGRRMFPNFHVRMSGLQPNENYILALDFIPCDEKRYRYSFRCSSWVQAGKGDPHLTPQIHVHPDGMAPGSYWMRQPILFDKLKLTNNPFDQNGHIILNSMHKYQLRLHIIWVDLPTDHPWPNSAKIKPYLSRTIKFKQTTFLAVTAYQNHQITQLKIMSNPFAKGFRDCDVEKWSHNEILQSSNAVQMAPIKGTKKKKNSHGDSGFPRISRKDEGNHFHSNSQRTSPSSSKNNKLSNKYGKYTTDRGFITHRSSTQIPEPMNSSQQEMEQFSLAKRPICYPTDMQTTNFTLDSSSSQLFSATNKHLVDCHDNCGCIMQYMDSNFYEQGLIDSDTQPVLPWYCTEQLADLPSVSQVPAAAVVQPDDCKTYLITNNHQINCRIFPCHSTKLMSTYAAEQNSPDLYSFPSVANLDERESMQ